MELLGLSVGSLLLKLPGVTIVKLSQEHCVEAVYLNQRSSFATDLWPRGVA